MEPIVAASVLAANFAHLADDIRAVELAGTDWLHCDIMDGRFVDNISFGPAMVETIRGLTSLPLDVHLMIEHADHYLPRFIKAGANSITVHVEPDAKHDVATSLKAIRAANCKAGITLNPETNYELVEPYLTSIDLLLVMTVHPGFGGQPFRSEQLAKVQRARAWARENNPALHIEVDGGINGETAKLCRDAGADVFVAGTAIFHATDYATAIASLRA